MHNQDNNKRQMVYTANLDTYNYNKQNQSQQKNDTKKTKKPSKFSKILTHSVLILLTVLIAISAFSIVSYCLNDTNLQSEIKNSLYSIDSTFYTDDTIDSDTMVKMQTFIENLPDSYKEIIKRDWIIIVSEQIPNELFQKSFVTINDYDTTGMIIGGYTFIQSRIVYVNSKTDMDTMYMSFVHEIGHVISFEGATLHGTKEWEQIYRQFLAKQDGVVEYDVSNEAEFFAASFEKYYNNTEKLQKENPDAYKFIDDTMRIEIKNLSFCDRFLMGCKNSINTLRVYYYFYIVDGNIKK